MLIVFLLIGGRWFYSISFGDENTGFAASDYGNVYRTTNGGANWTGYATATSEYQYSLKAFDVNNVISFGNKGTIIKTSNAGINWTDYSYGFRNSLFAVDFINENYGWTCGAQGFITNKLSALDFIKVVNAIDQGEIWVSRKILTKAMDQVLFS